MGPASENAGYGQLSQANDQRTYDASMGPASENAGYVAKLSRPHLPTKTLQWVQRPRTLVM